MPLLMLWLAGCAAVPRPVDLSVEQTACFELFEQVDMTIQQAGLRDEGDSPISGFPYLRSNRLLAALAGQALEGERLDNWLRHLGELDARARQFELQRHGQPVAGMTPQALGRELDTCRTRLLTADKQRRERLARLRKEAEVADDYVFAWRVAGLYPLSAPIFTLGINNWHNDIHATFATPLAELPQQGTLHRWASAIRQPLSDATLQQWLQNRDPLGLLQGEAAQQQQVFDHFAPIWEVDVADDHDRPARIIWRDGIQPDLQAPAEYRWLSHVLLDGTLLPQLNYLIWFPARPGEDIYAGWLDGLLWRVTLDTDGTPLLYDSIHPCGCYHQFFPAPRMQQRQDLSWFYRERPLIPQTAPVGEQLVIRIASRNHYIQRVYIADADHPVQTLQTLPYDQLRAIPSSDGNSHHSLFGRHGLVTGSERPERFLFWPMGIRSPGAMRQSGRQPTAFVGRRHFDDPHLIDSLFERVKP